ncbi:Peptidase M1 membrane alanine aminopeptidase [Dyadobacter fermentans DSM 18053]|uniref:Aminopeptidase N n=1 Tax=Dyadobacter fermentans (strain ATCC 700827 / DSM 18053 / CIP 107007 / KCTC 52180 / NS114) TaxID=471854 RepID=C6W6L8_DYAFD|nr:Peptidase M1 membrane alanine aminopeptidase [Dyadobacter fermentans DSM 18053]
MTGDNTRPFLNRLIFTILGILSFAFSTPAQAGTDADTLYRRNPGTITPKGPYRPERPRKNDILYTRLDVQLDWAKQQVPASAILKFKPHFYPQNTLELDAKGFEIKGISMLDTTGEYGDLTTEEIAGKVKKKLEFSYDKRKLTIKLGQEYTRKDTLFVKIDYIAKPNDVPRGKEDDSASDKGLYFINADGLDEGKPRQVWTQGETEGSSCWFPTIDAPNQKFTQDIYITVDSTYKTLSNGLLVGQEEGKKGTRTDHWKQTLPHAPYLAMIAVGDFTVAKDMMPNGLELSYYVEPKYGADAHAIFGRTPEMMGFFTNVFGVEYPWEKYAQIAVRDFVAGAMENTTATVHEEGVQNDARSLVDGNSDAVIAHELAHHWFGDYVTAEEWGQLPLNESFANYAEYLWSEYNDGRFEADWGNLQEMKEYLAESETKQVPMIRYFYKDRENMFDAHSYAKGGRILHMLRSLVGDDAFFAALQHYLKAHAFGTAEIDDLRNSFEKITGQDLNWFFDQWFHKPGHPVLKIDQQYVAAQGKVILKVKQAQDTVATTVYRLPVKVDVWVSGKMNRYDVVLDKVTQTLEFPAAKKPELVVFDADAQLLAVVEHDKNRPEMEFQYLHADRFLHKYEALASLEGALADTTARKILVKAMDDPFWKLRQMAISNFAEYAGEGFADIEKVIQARAQTDPHPQVRAEAIITLASFGDNNSDQIFKAALADSSYLVASVAIEKYLMSQPNDAAEIAAQFENSPNDAIITAVGNYYAGLAEPERFDWFLTKMKAMKPGDKYNFLQVFGKYLIKSKQDVQRKSIPVLEGLARDNSSYFVRFGAFQALGLLTDIQGVSALRKDIRAKETEPRLKEMYSQFGDL